jgi:hypothetical protein
VSKASIEQARRGAEIAKMLEEIALLKGSKADSAVNQTQYKSEVEHEIRAKDEELIVLKKQFRSIES